MKPIIPPPLIALLCAGLVWGIDRISPFDFLIGQARWFVGGGLIILGAYVAWLGVAQFNRHKTTIHPLHPEKASALVTGGIYKYTRNPMYLGMALALFGVVALFQDALGILAIAVFIVVINRLQIRPEESALRALFGAEFDAYCQRVRRWI